MKIRTKCGKEKELTKFSKCKRGKEGLQYKCKECCAKYNKKHYQKNREVIYERIKQYKQTEAGKEVHKIAKKKYRQTEAGKEAERRYCQNYRKQNPEKNIAHSVVNHLIRYRKLERRPCEICGSIINIDAHHDYYGKPLEVRWLCRKHHTEHHNNERKLYG